MKPSSSNTQASREAARAATRANKIAPAPVLPPRDSATDFPSLGKGGKGEVKGKKKEVAIVNNVIEPSITASDKVKTGGKKKSGKSKGGGVSDSGGGGNEDAYRKLETTPQKNGVVKKRSELKIDSLQVNGNDFPTLPPGFSTQPPPGFAANDLTFTSSSGQRYSIVPQHQFVAPTDFTRRNRTLVEKFMSALGGGSSSAVHEFKQLSNMFRSGEYPADEYYHHCKSVLGSDFPDVFPELLTLLPDIERQQQLYTHHLENGGNVQQLKVCATCSQVVAVSDLRTHLAAHSLDNHFPALGTPEPASVWKK